MIVARVSHLEAFRQWLNWKPFHDDDVEPTVEEFVYRLMEDEPSEAMLAGTALHKALELADQGVYDSLAAQGHVFEFATEFVMPPPPVREFRSTRHYGDLCVTGQIDGILNNSVIDYKTTRRFDPDRYLDGYQWRFYLDMMGLDVFQWTVFVLKDIKPKPIKDQDIEDKDIEPKAIEDKDIEPKLHQVQEVHVLKNYRYPELSNDCAQLAAHYYEFARQHIPAGYSEYLSKTLHLAA